MKKCVAGFMSAGFLFAAPILAQEKPEDEEAEEESPLLLEHVRVTGYNLKRTDLEGPAPVLTITRDELIESGMNTLDDYFRYLPQNLGSASETLRQYSEAAGSASIDLHGLGPDATLTLVDGYRVTPYGNYGAGVDPYFDVNAIPVSAIERIEIVKDGASAIYGADAIAGVVNIILRKNFVGMEASAGYLTTTKGDGEEWNVDFLYGWENEATNLMASISYFDKNPVLARDRSYTDDVDFSSEGGPNFRAYNSSPTSWFNYDTFAEGVDEDCGIDPKITSVIVDPFFGAFCGYNYANDAQLTDDSSTLGGTVSLEHAFSERLTFFADAFLSSRKNTQVLAPAPVVGGPLFPTLFGSPYVPPDHPQNPDQAPLEIYYRMVDAGPRIFDNDVDNYRIVAGLEGRYGRWDWQASLLTSQSKIDTVRRNAVLNSRLQLGLVGQGGESGDLWYNPFGADPGNSQEILDWISTDTEYGSKTTETAADVQASTWFGELPGGPVGLALGAQFRRQKIDQYADEIELSGDIAGGRQSAVIDSDRDVASAYGEMSLPLLPTLEAQLAVRYEHYSDFGSSTNPKVAIRWQPRESVVLRGSWGTSFKPPSFPELYDPATLNSGFYADVERCDITGSPLDCAYSNYNQVNQGNPDLQPEKGESLFFGLVWAPDFWPGFSFEVDYWSFTHSERIIDLNPQVILDAKGSEGIVRGPPTEEDIAIGAPGRIVLVEQTYRNSDELKTRGMDFSALYSWQTEKAGSFNTSVFATWISEYTLTDTNLLGVEAGYNYAGGYFANRFPIPRWRGNFNINWNLGNNSATATLHYIGDYQNNTNVWVDGIETDQPWIIADRVTLDAQYSRVFPQLRGATLRLGCENCTDKKPPVTFTQYGEYFHDPRGARVYIRWQQPF